MFLCMDSIFPKKVICKKLMMTTEMSNLIFNDLIDTSHF